MPSRWFSSNLGDLQLAKGYLSSKWPLLLSPLPLLITSSFYYLEDE